MEFRLLGSVSLFADGAAVDLGPARQRCVLTALAVEANRVISVDRLIQRVWGDDPPLRARATLVNYLSRLRQALGDVDAAVTRRSGGYALELEPSDIDLQRFRRLYARARTETGSSRAELLTEALGLWHGEALTGLPGDWAAAERDRLHRERRDAEWDLTDALLHLGHGEDLVADLAARVTEHPLDERAAGQYLLALHRAGRTADALAHYRGLRTRLVEELGTDPSAALQDRHRQILAADPALAVPLVAAPAVTPRQLPAAPAPFVGRRDVLDLLDAPGTGGAVAISVLAGAGGIGKTGLALHWAHRRLDRFPDGQLFVDLRGFSPEGKAMTPAVALRGFLATLGVEPGRIPADTHAQAGLFRSLVAGKRMLLMLDNAVDAAQVTDLLPGSGTCAVLVTSRNRLPGLLTGHGAHHLPLDVLGEAEACALLSGKLGSARTGAEPAAVDELVRLCGGFPLALTILAGHAQTRPRLPLAALAAELRGHGLGALAGADPVASLPAVLSWSHHTLTPAQLSVFTLLGVSPGPDIGVPAAASLAGLPAGQTRTILLDLEQASLVEQYPAGRYTMHDLIRRHAADTALALPEDTRTAALRRVVDFYLHTAHAADRLIDPHAPLVVLAEPAEGVGSVTLPDVPGALTWLTTEHDQLLAAQRTAAVHGWHEAAWQLAWVLATFHLRQGLRHEALTVWLAALDAAERLALADPTVHIRTHRLLGYSYCQLERYDEGVAHLDHALELAERHHDTAELAHTHRLLTRMWGCRGDFRRALGHAERALAYFHAVDDPPQKAEALNAAGWCNAVLGDYDTARTRCRAALDLFRHLHDFDGEAATLDSLGYIDHHSGDPDRAVRTYVRALALQRELGSIHNEADTLDNLGQAHTALGQPAEAREAWEKARSLYLEQERDDAAARVQRQLDSLGHTTG
jgi:DNA-binding SARP family transcriptional activator/tetratricopeptide (TPR) repeat protein